MLTKRIISCLDVKNSRVVKGVRFVELIDAGDPVAATKAYDAQGADELTFPDITASSDKRDIILVVVARTAERVFMPLTAEHIREALTKASAALAASIFQFGEHTIRECKEYLRKAGVSVRL